MCQNLWTQQVRFIFLSFRKHKVEMGKYLLVLFVETVHVTLKLCPFLAKDVLTVLCHNAVYWNICDCYDTTSSVCLLVEGRFILNFCVNLVFICGEVSCAVVYMPFQTGVVVSFETVQQNILSLKCSGRYWIFLRSWKFLEGASSYYNREWCFAVPVRPARRAFEPVSCCYK